MWRDEAATWKDDPLFLPPTDLSKVPVRPPTGGWAAPAAGMPAQVPGTAEEYLGKGGGPAEKVLGVTWWTRAFVVPPLEPDGVLRLQFGSVRQRAEIYVNERLVGYDLVGNTPFEANLTPLLRDGTLAPGREARLAVRVTNPGGNYDWIDTFAIEWGKYKIPVSHGFGGITGSVRLVATAPLHITDVYVQNTPEPRSINVLATVANRGAPVADAALRFTLREKSSGRVVAESLRSRLAFGAGETVVSCPITATDVSLWSPDSPALYTASVEVLAAGRPRDAQDQTFGFRWFAIDGLGENAVLRLNGKRIFLRTAISWGFWPVNGLYPTPELAEREVRVAKTLGLNMLNAHRGIAHPRVLDQADQLGLLFYCEPGGYLGGGKDPFAQALSREKLLRMVKRDRSRPSVVIWNMINEQTNTSLPTKEPELFTVHQRDLRDAHAIDPSRTVLYTSAWAGRHSDPGRDIAKMHIRPYGEDIVWNGWFDYHRAAGPEVWKQDFYQGPKQHYGRSANTGEIVFWGEDGALSAPPRLGLIHRELSGTARLGWDGQVYRDWHQIVENYLTVFGFRAAFPTADDWSRALGAVSLEHQGRKIEDHRICDANDGYAINGWEAQIIDNHSGIVDAFRNPKADPALIARHTRPLALAVKARQQVVTTGAESLVDIYLLNERDLRGDYSLRVSAVEPAGATRVLKTVPVSATGGDTFSQLLLEALPVNVGGSGFTRIQAELLPRDATTAAAPVADGQDQIFATEAASVPLRGRGAVLEPGKAVERFLSGYANVKLAPYGADSGDAPLDWLVVARPLGDEPYPIPAEAFFGLDGKPGLIATFVDGRDTKIVFTQRRDAVPALDVATGATPDPQVPTTENYRVHWEGALMPPATGEYLLRLNHRHGARLTLDGKVLVDAMAHWGNSVKEVRVSLTAGVPASLRIEVWQRSESGRFQLSWRTPEPAPATREELIERARRDGTTVLVLSDAHNWAPALAAATGATSTPSFTVGVNWKGGGFFSRPHPLLAGLPSGAALDWPYQAVVGGSRQAFDLAGAEVVVGACQTAPMRLGAAVAVVPVGKGRVVLSTLDLVGQLERSVTPTAVARRLVANYLAFAATPPAVSAADAIVATPAAPRAVRIMPIGDSITEGNAQLGSYRLELAEMLKKAGLAFEYVGSRKTNGGLGHEGYSGDNAAFVAKKFAEHLAENTPDIALIHAGHNYFAPDNPVPKIIAATERMIASLRAANPRVTVLVAQVIPSAKLPKYSYIPALNAELARVAPGWSNPESRVLLVDQATGFDPVEDTVADLVHPNASGIEKLARRWFEALRPLLSTPVSALP